MLAERDPESGRVNHWINWGLLRDTVRRAVRFLDNVIDANGFVQTVPKLAITARRTRRIGLGIMGLADVFFLLKVRYGSIESVVVASQIMEFIRYHAMMQSCDLARTLGTLANDLYCKSIYWDDQWETPKHLDTEKLFGVPWPEDTASAVCLNLDWPYLHKAIKEYGIRNIATTAVAPTGTLSLAAGVSGFGCEPVFGLIHKRRIINREDGKIRFQGTVLFSYY